MKQQLKNKMITGGWFALAAVLVVLLVSAVSNKNDKQCAGINVEITGGNDHFFVDAEEVTSLLNANGNLVGKPIREINLWVLEKRLENDKWVQNADLYIDGNEMLQVVIKENEPVVRIFTIGGYSYYIDSACKKLPLSNRLSARVPMVTNFPSNRTRWSKVDSALMAQVKDMSVYIKDHAFWNSQIAQVNINDNRELELIPTLGNQTILFGKPVDVEEKFDRLFSFYKQVWVKSGFEKYETLDVRFDDQVVAAKRGSAASLVVDSIKARQALEVLMERMKPAEQGDVTDSQPLKNDEPITANAAKHDNEKAEGRTPKAVMKPITTN